MDLINVIGNIAATLTTASFLPQAIKTIRTKNTENLSLMMYAMFVAGVMLWICYGWYHQQLPIIVGNSITLLFSGVILYYKIQPFKK